jgi:hypothetical protein
MLKHRLDTKSGMVKISFSLPANDPRLPAVVTGSFSGWDLEGVPLQRRSNGTCSAVVSVEPGSTVRFRYRGANGEWFNDDQVSERVANEFGTEDCVLRV